MIIYKATNTITGKIYIGLTTQTLHERRGQHIRKSRNNESNHHFSNAIRKYGSYNFQWEVIDTAEDMESLMELERYYIEKYDTFNNGYNSTTGGEIGKEFTEEVRQKMSILSSGENNPMYGTKRPEEVKQKISESLREREWTDEERQHRSEITTKRNLERGDDTKKKISETLSGRVLSEEHKKRIGEAGSKYTYKVTEPDGTVVIVENLSEYSREKGIATSTVLRSYRGYRTEKIK